MCAGGKNEKESGKDKEAWIFQTEGLFLDRMGLVQFPNRVWCPLWATIWTWGCRQIRG